MKFRIFSLLLMNSLLFINAVSAQEAYLVISGTVMDTKTQKPLAFASVSIKGRSIGTVSNQEGDFEFSVPAAYEKDTLMISYVGYKTIKQLVSSAHQKKLKQYLMDEDVIELATVTVLDGQAHAKQILDKSLADFDKVYATDDFMMDAFYREWEVKAFRSENFKKKASIAEAALRIHDKGYTPRGAKFLKEVVYLMELRKIQAPDHNSSGREFGWLLKQNPVNYRRDKAHFVIPGVLDIPNGMEYEFHSTMTGDDEEWYVIKANAPEFLATYTLYISTTDYALMRVDLTAQSEGGRFVHLRPDNIGYRMLSIDNTIRFRRVGGKPYVHYMRMNWDWEKVDSLGNREQVGRLYKELLVNNVINDPQKVKAMKDQMKIPPLKAEESLYDKIRPYNEAFWKNYNVIKENTLDKELQQALEASGKSVDETFNEKNAGKQKPDH